MERIYKMVAMTILIIINDDNNEGDDNENDDDGEDEDKDYQDDPG